jgi:hypothetical protein
MANQHHLNLLKPGWSRDSSIQNVTNHEWCESFHAAPFSRKNLHSRLVYSSFWRKTL